MSRVNLKEFRPIDFASFVPEQDPNNALFPRVSMVAKMLHEIPWFKKSNTEETEISEQLYSDVSDIAKNPKKRQAFMAGLDPILFEDMNPQSNPNKNISVEMGGSQVNVRNPFALSDGEEELYKKRSELDDWRNAFNDWSSLSIDDIAKDKDTTTQFQEFVRQSGNNIDVDGIVGTKTRKAYKDLFNNKDKYENEAKKRIYGDVEDDGRDIFAEPTGFNLNFLSTVFDDE